MSSKYDVRIIGFQNNDFLKLRKRENQKAQGSYLSFSYFNNITVNKVEIQDGDYPLKTAYKKLSGILANGSKAVSRQSILAFSEYPHDKNDAQDRIEAFWNDAAHRLFFATLIKVSTDSKVADAISRIETVFEGCKERYLLYKTFEFDEIILFFKGNSFKEYSDLAMRLNFEQIPSSINSIVDTITVCSFSKKPNLYKSNPNDEKFGVHICLGTENLSKLNNFLDSFEENHHCGSVKKCLLGRNDIALINPNADINWLWSLYDEYMSQKEATVTTFKLTVLTDLPYCELTDENHSLKQSPLLECNIKRLKSSIKGLINSYKVFCCNLHMKPNEVFIRMLYDISDNILYMQQSQLADDLAVCLLPQFDDFINYLKAAFSYNIPPENINEEINKLWTLINKFYLNIAVLINSTVHSSRQFIQIPHFSAPAFEMPPKIMAYYSIMLRKMAGILKDDEKNKCGIILAPKLVEELEVESLALQITEPRQFISIGIGENLFCNVKMTVATASHELSHFIGKKIRNRKTRAESILAYFIATFIVYVDMEFWRLIYGDQTIDTSHINMNEILSVAKKLSKKYFSDIVGKRPRETDLYLKNIDKIANGAILLFRKNSEFVTDIYNSLYNKKSDPSITEILRDNFNLDEPESRQKSESSAFSKKNLTYFNKTYCNFCSEYVFTNAVERFIAKTNKTEFLDDMRYKTEFYLYHIFSEAYADISMLLLFDMNCEEYCKLFLEDSSIMFDKTSEGELIRIFCVISAMHSKQIWNELPTFDLNPENPNIRILNEGLSAINTASPKTFLDFLKKNEFDITLMGVTVPYLSKCIDDISKHLESKSVELEKMRKLYRSADSGESVTGFLDKIRDLEKDYLNLYGKPQK